MFHFCFLKCLTWLIHLFRIGFEYLLQFAIVFIHQLLQVHLWSLSLFLLLFLFNFGFLFNRLNNFFFFLLFPAFELFFPVFRRVFHLFIMGKFLWFILFYIRFPVFYIDLLGQICFTLQIKDLGFFFLALQQRCLHLFLSILFFLFHFLLWLFLFLVSFIFYFLLFELFYLFELFFIVFSLFWLLIVDYIFLLSSLKVVFGCIMNNWLILMAFFIFRLLTKL